MRAKHAIAAIIIACVSLASAKETSSSRVDTAKVVASSEVVWNYQRLDQFNSRARPRNRVDRTGYVVEIRVTDCEACRRYQATELPALLKYGYDCKVLKAQAASVCLLYKGKVIAEQAYWRAKDIEKFVRNRQKPKG